MAIAENLAAKLHELGDVLTSEFALAGWFGVDYILRDGNPWPVEINPATPRRSKFMNWRRAERCWPTIGARATEMRLPGAPPARADLPQSPVIAKVVVYASRTLTFPGIALEEHESDDLFAVRSIADIPSPGSRIEPGQPVMTLLA